MLPIFAIARDQRRRGNPADSSPVQCSTLEGLTRGFHKNARSRDDRATVAPPCVAAPRACGAKGALRHTIVDLTPR
jgi:hypothetical protein